MGTELYSRTRHEDRGHGLLILTECSDGLGKGTRLELYASTHDDCPIEIRTVEEARELGRALLRWGRRPRAEPGRYSAGEKVPASGIWGNQGGREAALTQGDRFPPSVTTWGAVRLVNSSRRRRRRTVE